MKITIIAPNGYKIFFSLEREKIEKWGRDLIRRSELTPVNDIIFNFKEDTNEVNENDI